MTASISRRRRAPRLVVKILGFTFAMTASVLAAVFTLVSWHTSERVAREIVGSLEASQLRFADIEEDRQRERRLQAAALVENPTLKAAVDTYQSERNAGESPDQLVRTIQHELNKLQAVMSLPALSVTDARGVILASAGPLNADWAVGEVVPLHVGADGMPAESTVARSDRVYLTTVVPLILEDDIVGEFLLASPLDDTYARRLATEAGTDVAILVNGVVIASSLSPDLWPAATRGPLPAAGAISLDGRKFVVRRLIAVGGAEVFAFGSVAAPVGAAMRRAAIELIGIAAGALLLAGLGSWWLARTLASPIGQLRTTLAHMAEARDFERPVPASGASLELDALADTFDVLRKAVALAEAESEASSVGVIGTLAEALDARDPYTAGHSERVADLSVAIGREMGLSDDDIETLRVGALLHDIGKIGVSDAILRKPGTLTDEEFEQIKLHATLGARILKPLRFLTAQLLIVELHHERPDGRGYPHGLSGDQIPLAASIVHAADAFDAMTTGRAYRPGRPVSEAMAELVRNAGTDFDAQVIQAIANLPAAVLARPSPAPYRFRSAAADRARRSAG